MVAGLANTVKGLQNDGTEGQGNSPLGDGGGTREKATSPTAALEGKFNRVNSGILVSGGLPVQPSRPAFGLDPDFKVDLKSIGAGLIGSRLLLSGRPDGRSLESDFLIIGFWVSYRILALKGPRLPIKLEIHSDWLLAVYVSVAERLSKETWSCYK